MSVATEQASARVDKPRKEEAAGAWRGAYGETGMQRFFIMEFGAVGGNKRAVQMVCDGLIGSRSDSLVLSVSRILRYSTSFDAHRCAPGMSCLSG